VKTFLAAVSVLGLAGAAGFVGWSVLSRPTDVFVTGEAAQAFNLQTGLTATSSRSIATGETLRDAVAAPPASSLTRPIPLEGMAVRGIGPAARPAAASGFARDLPVRVVRKARKTRLFMNLLAKPASFLMAQTSLRSARAMRAFLSDRRRVEAYLDSPLVRVALNSAAFTKAVLGNGRLVRAFLGSPALQDPALVRELLRSPMMRKMLDCPGIQQALADPETIMGLVSDPETLRFVAEHPQALQSIASAAPALADAFRR